MQTNSFNEQLMPDVVKSERLRRLRIWLAAAAFIVFAWYCFHCLAWLAWSVGIVPIVDYDPAVTQWLLIGESWQKVRVSQDFTLAGYSLVFLTAVLAYYVGRLVYHLDFAMVFQRRDRWLLAGWLIGTPIIAAEGHLLLMLLSQFPLAQHWPTISGIAAWAIFIASANLFGDFWGWVMRKRRVSREISDR